MRRIASIVCVMILSVAGCGGQSDHPPAGVNTEDAASPWSSDGSSTVITPLEDGGTSVPVDDDAGVLLVIDGSTSLTDALPPLLPDGDTLLDSSSTVDTGASSQDAGSDAGPPDAGPADAGPTCTASGFHLCVTDAGAICADDNSPETCGTSCSPCPTPANGVASCGGGSCSYACDNGYIACSTGCCSCGDTRSDPNNCGSCGHVCAGVESCTNGVCGAVVVASNQANVYAIAVDEENVYWTTTGASASILQAPVGGGGASVLVTSANAYPASLAVALGEVYWSDAAGGTINRVPVGGGTSIPLFSGLDEPTTLALSGGRLFVALAPYNGTGSIEYASTVASALTPIAAGQMLSDPASLAVGASVYWTTQTDVMTSGSSGATPFATYQYPYAVATDGTNVYWTSGLSNGAVMQESAAGGSRITLATNQYYSNTIAIDAANVYWTTGQGGAGTVMSAPIGGGTPVTIAANQPYPFALAVNSTHVFWVNFGDGSIVSAPK